MRRPFPFYPACPVCGDPRTNPTTLAVRWEWDEEGSLVVGSFVPDARHTGYADRLHGGILTALFDECLAWAAAVSCCSFCLTGELRVRFHAPAPIGGALSFRARTAARWARYVRAEGEVLAADGTVVARASGTYSALPREESRAMSAALTGAPGCVDVLATPAEGTAP